MMAVAGSNFNATEKLRWMARVREVAEYCREQRRNSRLSNVFTAQMQAKVQYIAHGGRAVQRILAVVLGSLLGLATLAIAEVACRPNIFGGQDCAGDGVSSRSRPNLFGGYDTTFGDGTRLTSRPNIFGGQDYRTQDGRTVTCRPNIFGGEDCR